jgi:hypothetical protein
MEAVEVREGIDGLGYVLRFEVVAISQRKEDYFIAHAQSQTLRSYHIIVLLCTLS